MHLPLLQALNRHRPSVRDSIFLLSLPCPQIELEAALGLSKTAISLRAERLLQAGLIERCPMEDRRQQWLDITAQGKALLADVRAKIDAALAAGQSHLMPAE